VVKESNLKTHKVQFIFQEVENPSFPSRDATFCYFAQFVCYFAQFVSHC